VSTVEEQPPGWIASVRSTATAVTERVVELRPETPLVDAAWETWERDARHGGGLLAGALAFRLFLLVVPLLMLLSAGLGFWSSATDGGAAAAGEELGFSETIVSTMDVVGAQAQQGRWFTLLAGLVALVVAVRTLAKALRLAHVLAWGLGRRSFTRQVAAVGVGVASTAALVGLAVAAHGVRSVLPAGGLLATFLIGPAWGAAWLAVSLVLPRAEDAPWTALLPGAALVAVASQALYAVTVLYMAERVTDMSATYGPLGVAIVLLLWLYLLGRVMVASAMLNATLWDRRRRGERNYGPLDLRSFRPVR
jgi:uncharacterized BrkB/YihY/UPF0761 family membrane protein